MNVAAGFQEQLVFHATGQRQGEALEALDGLHLRPALLAGYRELAGLRYDFPLVLVEGGVGDGAVRALSGVIDDLLSEIAPRGIDGERLRRLVLKVERGMRGLVADGTTGRLSELWPLASAAAAADDEGAAGVLIRAAESLGSDGEVLDCDPEMPARLLRHLWMAAQARKARRFQARAGALAVQLSDILRAAFIHSDAGRQPENLRASVGGPHQAIFDFAVMSKLLPAVAGGHDLPALRRERIEWALGVLRSQPFFPLAAGSPAAPDAAGLAFEFDDCAGAVAAFQARRAGMVELVKALSIAELEADGRYDEAAHDPLFAAFDASSLGAADLATFPDYLVCIRPGQSGAPGNARLMEVLASGLPIKVLVQSVEVMEASPLGDGHLVFGVHGAQLASTALGLDNVFVLQSSASNLLRSRGGIDRGMAYPGPALFSVYSGPGPESSRLPPYLTTAAAMQGRAFPAFSSDPGAGSDLAARFSLADNPQPALDWPVEDLDYADPELQRVSERLAFTIVDFAATDGRYARYFARVPRMAWGPQMVSVEGWLALEPSEQDDAVPYIAVVDEHDALHRLVVDARLMQAARRCLEMWHRLQELGHVHDAHVEPLVSPVRNGHGEPGAEVDAAIVAAPSAAGPIAPTPPPEVEAPAVRPPDEPYIETIRCSSCNECTLINERMFAYDANRRAYIADLAAGTFRELVEAAENCQLSIIHPGRPRDPNEPDLEALMKRAEPFA